MENKKQSILQVNYLEKTGGAARIAWTLHNAYQNLGYDARMIVQIKETSDDKVFLIENRENRYLFSRFMLKLNEIIKKHDFQIFGKNISGIPYRLAYIDDWIKHQLGFENYYFPGTTKIIQTAKSTPDIIHLHNLHSNYFDLRYLTKLSYAKPVVLTLHDCWLLTGHCAYFLDCPRWKSGCGNCPYLGITYPFPVDRTAYNWGRKKEIFENSKLNIVTPSKWLMDIVENSILGPAIANKKVINNGIDPKVFHPQSKTQLREELNLPIDAMILLFVVSGNMQKHSFKDYTTIEKAIQEISFLQPEKKLLFLGLGDSGPVKHIGKIEMRFLPYAKELESVAKYYQASDLYLHAAKADNFPNVVLEALACGTPVVATNVGGISEQIEDGVDGYLVSPGDSKAMAAKVVDIVQNKKLYSYMSKAAAKKASFFSVERMSTEYLQFYDQISQGWQK